uniref:NAD(P)(+)--arginine ADP-ribosyltransferase n=1 Tax=Gasterosteus aculeatus TaxID=69293 RepID=G3N6Q1_GASAC
HLLMGQCILMIPFIPVKLLAGRKPVAPPPLPLDMAPNSVDDMYEGCAAEMEKKAVEFLKKERNDNKVFNQIWEELKANQPTKVLSKEEITALSVYTSDTTYPGFNKATREQGPKYKTAFKYHALHFYLTRAVQKLNALQKECYNVYRRTNVFFRQDVLNKEVRFSSFASSSLRDDLTDFGDKSCFEIYTCMGADVMEHSEFENEAEVLIPPYEVFKVTDSVGTEGRSVAAGASADHRKSSAHFCSFRRPASCSAVGGGGW